MKLAKKILLIIGYVLLISFIIYGIYFIVNIINDSQIEPDNRFLPMVLLVSLGAIILGISLLLGFAATIITFLLRKKEEASGFIAGGALVALSILSEMIFVVIMAVI